MHYIRKRKQEYIALTCQRIVTCCHFVKLQLPWIL